MLHLLFKFVTNSSIQLIIIGMILRKNKYRAVFTEKARSIIYENYIHSVFAINEFRIELTTPGNDKN